MLFLSGSNTFRDLLASILEFPQTSDRRVGYKVEEKVVEFITLNDILPFSI
jgi:hypothetical protein